jgi:hypothetical protein
MRTFPSFSITAAVTDMYSGSVMTVIAFYFAAALRLLPSTFKNSTKDFSPFVASLKK